LLGAVVSVAALLIAIAGAELAVRLLGVPERVYPDYRVVTAQLDGAILEHNFLQPHPTRLWQNTPGKGEVDARGYRRTLQPEPTGDALRVLFLGDSVTYGHDAAWDESLPSAAARLAGGRVVSVNAGVVGYSSFQGLQTLRVDRPHRDADVVVVSFYQNDEDEGCLHDVQLYEHNRRLLRTDSLLAGSRLHNLWALRRLSREEARSLMQPHCDDGQLLRVPPEDFTANLVAIHAEVERAGAQTLFVAQPANPVTLLRQPHYGAYREAFERAVAQTGAPSLDLPELSLAADPAEVGHLFLDRHKCHLTPAGYEHLATRILESLEAMTGRALLDTPGGAP